MQIPFSEPSKEPQNFIPFLKGCNMVGGCLDPRQLILSAYVNQVCEGKAREAAKLFDIAQQLPDKLNLN